MFMHQPGYGEMSTDNNFKPAMIDDMIKVNQLYQTESHLNLDDHIPPIEMGSHPVTSAEKHSRASLEDLLAQ